MDQLEPTILLALVRFPHNLVAYHPNSGAAGLMKLFLHEIISSDVKKSIYVDIIADGVRDGTFSASGDPERIAAQLLALEDGLVLHEMSRNQNVDPQTVVSDFAGAAASLLGLPSDPGLTRAEDTQTGV